MCDVSISINHLSTAVIHLDSQYHIKSLNHSAEQFFGLSTRQLIGANFFDFVSSGISYELISKLADKRSSASVLDVKMAVAKGEVNINLMVTLVNRDSIASGFLIEIQSSDTPKNILKDLSLQQQSRVSEHLIRNLAHEIKNPLGGIKGAGQLLEKKLPEDFPKKYTQIIIRESNRLGELVDRLLMPAKIEKSVTTNIHLLIEQALEVLLLQNPINNIEIKKDYDPSIPDLSLAPNQIQQVLLNLIKNAIEALIPIVDIKGKIILKTRIKNQYTIGESQHRQVLKIDITDNGDGIEKNLVKDIFFPTISGKQSSGLGLSIAQSLVQRHQGIIELTQSKQVTCFSVLLPFDQK